MKLTIIGCAPAAPNPGAASSAYLLHSGQGQLLLECGHGAASKVLLYTTLEQVQAIIVSHMHPDHFFDLVPLKYLLQEAGLRVALYLPPTGPSTLSAIANALGEKDEFWERAYDIRMFDPDSRLDVLGLQVTMTRTHHFIPAWSMRFNDPSTGRSLGYTSDTSPTDAICEHLRDCSVLLAEATLENPADSSDAQGHMTGCEAGLLARDCGVEELVLTHYPQSKGERLLADARHGFPDRSSLAVEGLTFTI